MPSSIKISDMQPPVTAPLSLKVEVGKREYSGNIGQDGFSFGGTIILELRFSFSDEDRKRIQEMRNSAVKRKQQELLANGYKLRFQGIPLPKEQTKEISDIPKQGDELTLRKSLFLDDLKERDVFSGVTVVSDLAVSKDLPLRSGGNTSTLEGSIGIDSRKGQGKPDSRLSGAVKKMINAFESSSPQGSPLVPRIKSESSLEGMSSSSDASTGPSVKPPTPGASSNVSGNTPTGFVARTSGNRYFC